MSEKDNYSSKPGMSEVGTGLGDVEGMWYESKLNDKI